jgi:ceramide glucosyltransferase
LTETLSFIAVAGMAVQFFGMGCMLIFYFFKRPGKLKTNNIPGVSIIKTCYQAVDNEKENFDEFFHQKYKGPIEILFMVSNETDPVVPIIREYLKKYPDFDAKLIISKTRNAPRLKYDALYDGYHQSKHEIIILSDSDVIIQDNYVEQMVACFQNPSVSFVTTPQYDIHANNFATAFKTLGNNTDVGTFMSILDIFITKKGMAWGHSIGFKRSEFAQFADYAWDVLNRSLADDLSLPHIFVEQGRKVVFRNINCPVWYGDKTWAQVLDQKRRFALCQKAVVGNRYAYLGGIILYPQIFAAANLLVSLFSPESIQLFLAVMATRIAASFLFEALFVGSVWLPLRYFWTIVLWDLMQVYFVLYAFRKNDINFHGNNYEIVDRLYVKTNDSTL